MSEKIKNNDRNGYSNKKLAAYGSGQISDITAYQTFSFLNLHTLNIILIVPFEVRFQ